MVQSNGTRADWHRFSQRRAGRVRYSIRRFSLMTVLCAAKRAMPISGAACCMRVNLSAAIFSFYSPDVKRRCVIGFSGGQERDHAFLAKPVQSQSVPAANPGFLKDMFEVYLDRAGPDAEFLSDFAILEALLD